jgi:hypothetical protein
MSAVGTAYRGSGLCPPRPLRIACAALLHPQTEPHGSGPHVITVLLHIHQITGSNLGSDSGFRG